MDSWTNTRDIDETYGLESHARQGALSGGAATRRYLDTTARVWKLLLIPLLLLPVAAVGVGIVTGGSASTSADVWVGQSATAQLAWLSPLASPAADAAGELNQFLQTYQFDQAVAQHAPSYWAKAASKPNRKIWIKQSLSKTVHVQTHGSNLIQISYQDKNTTTGIQIIRAMLKVGSNEIARLAHQQAMITETRYAAEEKTDRSRLEHYSAQLGAYANRHDIPSGKIASASLTDPTLSSLYQSVQSAEVDLRNAVRLHSAAVSPAVGPTLVIIDGPSTAAPTLTKKTLILDLGMGLALGILLASAYVVISTGKDQSIRRPYEVPVMVGLDVLAVLPRTAFTDDYATASGL